MVEDVDRYKFVEPGALQHGELEVEPDDVIANLPYRSGCAMWFDHHVSNRIDEDFHGSWWIAPSAARVIYEYYSDERLKEYEELVEITDRIDSASLTMEEQRDPRGYILVSMTVSGKAPWDEKYCLRLIELLRQNDLAGLMADEMVKENCDQYTELNNEFGEVIGLYSDMEDNVLVTDFRHRWSGKQGNRFLAFTLFPECDIWVKIMDHPQEKNLCVISVGHNIFNRTNPVNAGKLLTKYGGGGHKGAGGCRVENNFADKVLREIIGACKREE